MEILENASSLMSKLSTVTVSIRQRLNSPLEGVPVAPAERGRGRPRETLDVLTVSRMNAIPFVGTYL
jgi:hypothetical protein